MRLDEEGLVRQRVETADGEHRGTVLFDGEVTGTNGGRWLGVDWDEPGRGKHDGSYKGTRYFHARYLLPPLMTN
jgi:dynactin complex subunit